MAREIEADRRQERVDAEEERIDRGQARRVLDFAAHAFALFHRETLVVQADTEDARAVAADQLDLLLDRRDPVAERLLIVEAVEAYTTVGEISDRLRGVFGEYEEAVTV